MSGTVRLFLATHAVALRELLATSLDASASFEVTGQCSSAAEALVQVPEADPDLLVASRLLPDGTGAQLVRDLRAAGSTVPALLLSNTIDAAMLADALEAGAVGIETIWIDRPDLEQALLRASRSQIVAPADLLRSMLDPPPHGPDPVEALSDHEREVFELVGEGLSNPEIAERLHLAPGTVRNYVSRVMAKVGMRRRAEVIAYVASRGDRPDGRDSVAVWQ